MVIRRRLPTVRIWDGIRAMAIVISSGIVLGKIGVLERVRVRPVRVRVRVMVRVRIRGDCD